MNRLRHYVLPGTLFFLMISFAKAQAPGTGAITVQIFDPSGAAVSNARVSVVNEQTNWSRTGSTNAEGLLRMTLLVPGEYSVVVNAPGFQQNILHSIHVVGSETAVVNAKLEVNPVAAVQVQVMESAELAQTESAALGRVTEANTIVAVPLANRNFTQILALSPGVIAPLPDAGQLGTNTQNVSANGAKTTANNFQFDGIDANNISKNSFRSALAAETGIALPNPDTIAEFKVQTGQYDAGYGRSTGANVDFVSKAGANNFHGSLWEFFRNDALNANDFFLNQQGQPRPILRQNQFGGVLGGPIKKDKSFFFASYQGTLQLNGEATGSLMSTFLPPLTSDRSATALGSLFAGQAGINGGAAVAADGSNINPVALALLNFKLPNGNYLIPNPQTISNGLGASTFSIPAKYREDQFIVNLDHKLSDANQLSGRFFYSRQLENLPFGSFAATVPGFGQNQIERNHVFVLSDTHAFNPNLTNVARFGFIRFNGSAFSADLNGSDIGMQTPADRPGLPSIQVNGLFQIGLFQSSVFENTNTFVWQDTISLTRGRHSLRMGGEAKRHQLVADPSVPLGFLLFLSFPDFLLGESAAQNGSNQSNVFFSLGGAGIFRKDERYTDFAGFIQDDIKITPRLTLNAGLRYEVFGPPTEIHGRLSNFDPSIASPQVLPSGSLSGFVLAANYNGPLAPGVLKSGDAHLWNSDYKDLGPRFGFAYRMFSRSTFVLRGGYGIYYERLSGELAAQNVGQAPFAAEPSLQGVQNAAATFQQPFNPPLPPSSAFPIFIPRTPASGLSVIGVSRSIASPYTQQYDLNIQYEFAQDFLWQVGYVGSKSMRLAGCPQFNQALIATPQNPVNGQITTTNENVTQRVPFAGIAGAGSFFCGSSLDANYNGLQTSVIKRFSKGLDFQSSYTFSKTLDFSSGNRGLDFLERNFIGNDQTNPRQSRGPNDFDRTHRFVLSFVYNPPSLKFGPRLVRSAISHWQFSGVSVFQSGLPITVTDSLAGSVYGNLSFTNRAQCTGLSPASSGSLTDRLGGYLNRAAFGPPPAIGDGTGFGSCGVGILRGPDQRNLDFGIQRNFTLAEAGTLQFRTEFFNLTNTPKFDLPAVTDVSVTGAAFGRISSSAANPRIIQFALKYSF